MTTAIPAALQVLGSDFATTSTTWVDVTGLSTTIVTTVTTHLFLSLTGLFTTNLGPTIVGYRISVVGDSDYGDQYEIDAGPITRLEIIRRTNNTLSPGTYTVKIQCKVADDLGGGGNCQVLTGSTLTAIGLEGGDATVRQLLDGFEWFNLATSLATTQIDRYASNSVNLTEQTLAIKNGSVTAIAIKSNEARAAGTVTAEVYINGTATGFYATLDGTNTTFKLTTQAKGITTFNVGDIITVQISSSSWAPTTADMKVSVEIDS